ETPPHAGRRRPLRGVLGKALGKPDLPDPEERFVERLSAVPSPAVRVVAALVQRHRKPNARFASSANVRYKNAWPRPSVRVTIGCSRRIDNDTTACRHQIRVSAGM